MKELPFTLYEFAAILIPGFILAMLFRIYSGPLLGLDLGNAIHGSFLLCMSYVLGQIIAQFAILTFDKFAKQFLGEPALIFLGEKKPKNWQNFLLKSYFSSLSEKDAAEYIAIANIGSPKEIMAVTYGKVFTLARFDETQFARLEHFSRLYGFSRNISFGAMVVFLFSLYQSLVLKEEGLAIHCVLAFVVFVTMFYRYLQFFKMYTTDLINWYRCKPLLPTKP